VIDRQRRNGKPGCAERRVGGRRLFEPLVHVAFRFGSAAIQVCGDSIRFVD
jgi:hypothetical protein